jgi:hypothetical protein
MMKCYEIEFDIGGGDTSLSFVFAENESVAADAYNEYGHEVTPDDFTEIDTNDRYYKAWAKTYGPRKNVYRVIGGELV